MPMFAYRGFDAGGRAVAGTLDADSPRAIKASLRRDGIFLTDLQEDASAQSGGSGGRRLFSGPRWVRRVSTGELALTTRQLATLVNAGIPLVDGLVALIDQVENPRLKSIWSDVKQKVNEGAAFGDALAQHPQIFSGLYINMVRAGESSGALDVVLSRLADFTESQADLRAKLTGTLIYPALMVVMAFGVVTLLMVVVVPNITATFASRHVALPLSTQLLIAISALMRDTWFILLPALGGSLYGLRRYFSGPKGRPVWDRLVLKVPLFGPLIRMVAVTRFCKTLSTLIASGVPLLSAFDIVKNVVQNTVLAEVIQTARDCVKEGESIAAPLKRSGHFPPIVTHMIAIGEKSGQLEQMLGNVARSYEVQVDARLRAMTSVLEPLLLVVMGTVIGFIVMSVLQPLLNMSSLA